MFFGSLLRLCSFAVSAGLVFLLSPQEPALNWPHREQLSIWKEARATVFQGLRRVKADLDSSRKDAHRDRPGALESMTVTTEPADIPSAAAAAEKAAVMGRHMVILGSGEQPDFAPVRNTVRTLSLFGIFPKREHDKF